MAGREFHHGPYLYTHEDPDIDAVSSLWGSVRFVPGMKDARIILVSGNWDGIGMRDCDMAVDVRAGGRGIKGELETLPDGKAIIHSSFKYIIDHYAPEDDRKALLPWVRFIDLQDSRGSAVGELVRSTNDPDAMWILSMSTFSAVLAALKLVHGKSSLVVIQRVFEIFDGFLEIGRGNVRAEKEADQAQLFGGGQVALVTDKKEVRTDHVLWERGVVAIVFVEGNNIGVLRTRHDRGGVLCNDGSLFSASHPRLLEIISKAGETVGDFSADWFAHPSGFLFCHGSRKAMAKYPSKVSPMDLVHTLVELLGIPEEPEGDGPICGLD
ncbi:MAG: hypothetical protein HZA94_03605 [Candidatus Vogelbacteria bacterium]|nr:hypothetical protein [Candidatus Vogelbacteria bacterium]